MAFENDPEGRRVAEGYAGGHFDKARIVTREVFASYADEWTPEVFLKEITDAIAAIPAEFMASAKVELEGYESGKLLITYTGPESSETVAERIRRCEEYVAERRANEKREFERLKAKFEPKS